MVTFWLIILGVLVFAIVCFVIAGRHARPAILDPGVNPSAIDPDDPCVSLPKTADPSAISARTHEPADVPDIVRDPEAIVFKLTGSESGNGNFRKHHFTRDDVDPVLIELLETTLRALPELPRLSINLLPILCEPGSGMKEIAQLVERDQAIASRLMRWVNSAIFGLEGKVDSINRAVILLGLDTVRSAVIYDSFKHILNPQDLSGLSIELIWKHCAAVSVTAKHFGRMIHGVDPDVAATAGLLHDIGLLLMLITERKNLAKALESMNQSSDPLIDFEDRHSGFNHQVMGECFCRAWGLPEIIIEAIGHHHNPMEDDSSALATLIWLSDYIVSRVGFACPESFQQYLDESEIAEVTGKLGIEGKLGLLISAGLLRQVQKTTVVWHWENKKEKSTIARNLLSAETTA